MHAVIDGYVDEGRVGTSRVAGRDGPTRFCSVAHPFGWVLSHPDRSSACLYQARTEVETGLKSFVFKSRMRLEFLFTPNEVGEGCGVTGLSD